MMSIRILHVFTFFREYYLNICQRKQVVGFTFLGFLLIKIYFVL